MKVLVCGGRDFDDREYLFEVLDRLRAGRHFTQVIHGAAPGTDTLGGLWGEARCIAVRAFPAKWKELGRKAGPIRNQQMLDEGRPDLIVAFPGGRGTADMVRRARANGVRVDEIALRPGRIRLHGLAIDPNPKLGV